MKRIAAVLGVALLAACSEPTSIVPGELVGSWVEAQPLSPGGSMDRILAFDRDGRYRWRVDAYGLYPGQAAGDLSAWSETRGTYRVNGHRLQFQPLSRTWWDRFYDDPGPFTTDAEGRFLDDATFAVLGDELVIRYLSYPADGPVETTMRLRRR